MKSKQVVLEESGAEKIIGKQIKKTKEQKIEGGTTPILGKIKYQRERATQRFAASLISHLF